ncbi:MAG: hypothetical protein R3F22_02880 [Lysobacteraceae bacterium]
MSTPGIMKMCDKYDRDEIQIVSLELVHIPVDIGDDNVDFQIALTNGETWTGTFFTLANIEKVMRARTLSGESAGGLHFWCKEMIVVRDLSHSTLAKVVADLVSTGEYLTALNKAD